MTRDPIGANGGVDAYGYCASGPVGAADPSGLQLAPAAAAGAEAAGIGGAGALTLLGLAGVCSARIGWGIGQWLNGHLPGLGASQRYYGNILGGSRSYIPADPPPAHKKPRNRLSTDDWLDLVNELKEYYPKAGSDDDDCERAHARCLRKVNQLKAQGKIIKSDAVRLRIVCDQARERCLGR